jgi:hypothetical protein
MSATPETPIRTFGAGSGSELESSSSAKPSPVRPVEVPVDVDLGPGSTDLDDLREELAESVVREPVVLPVPHRGGWEAVFATRVDHELLAKWRRASKSANHPDGFDELQMAERLLANQNVGLIRNGEELLDQGAPLTFRSPRFLELISEGRPMVAVRKFFDNDGHVISAANEVLRAAGYGEDLASAGSDPTPRR